MDAQRATIQSYVKAGKTFTETFQFLQHAYKDKAMCRTAVFKWFRQFKRGRESFESLRGKHQKTLVRTDKNVALVKKIITDDGRLTLEDISLASGLSKTTAYRILRKDLGFSKLSARWVPRLLSDDHKSNHLEFSRNFIRQHFQHGKAFLSSIVTCDESWVNFYTPELKNQSKQWLPKGSKPPIKAKTAASNKKQC